MLSFTKFGRVGGTFLARLFGTSSNLNGKTLVTGIHKNTGIANVVLDSPPLNVLTRDYLMKCTDSIKEINNSSDIRGVILSSNSKVFSAGLNLHDLYQSITRICITFTHFPEGLCGLHCTRSHEELISYWTIVQDWFLSWYGAHKPVVAAINGHAIAGGCFFALMCDYRVMANEGKCKIGMTETSVGLQPITFFGKFACKLLGQRDGELAIKLGEMLTPQEAHKIGMVDELCSAENVEIQAEKMLERLIKIPGQTFHDIKLNVRKDIIDELSSERKADAENFAEFISRNYVQKILENHMKQLNG